MYAARIRAARAFAGLSQDELAHELGVEVQTIKRRENGKADPKRQELLAIAAVTGVPIEFLDYGFTNATLDSQTVGQEIASQLEIQMRVLKRIEELVSVLRGVQVTSEPVSVEEATTKGPELPATSPDQLPSEPQTAPTQRPSRKAAPAKDAAPQRQPQRAS